MIKVVDDISSMNNRIKQYDEYLDQHIANVNKSLEVLLPHLQKDFDSDLINKIKDNCMNHDKSKYEEDEYYPYLDWFYPVEDKDKSQNEFDLAWLKHQHRNPHHPQHWVLRRDSNEEVILDMPVEYIIEMLCDWHSFSAKNPESTAWSWYEDNSDNMLLSDNTRKVIKKYIKYLKDPLIEVGDNDD